MKFWLAGAAGGTLLDSLLATVRFRVLTAEPYRTQKVIFALWHGRLLPLTYYHRKQNIATLISQSADGEYIARVVERWGYRVARGSSSRGGREALRELLRAARAGHSLAITPDGPRGPRQKLKRGVLTAAQLSGVPILPMSGAATRAWWFEGWDRFLLPKPFSTVFIRYGEPVMVPRDADESQLLQLEARIEQVLDGLTEQTDADARR